METYQKQVFPRLDFAQFVQRLILIGSMDTQRASLPGHSYQGKLVRVVIGEIFDVAVDLRKSSPHFGKWVGAILSDKNKTQLWIPPGFAHGFLVLSKHADVVYKTTDFYDRESDRTIYWNDPDLGILWPIPDGIQPLVSEKDKSGTLFSKAEVFE